MVGRHVACTANMDPQKDMPFRQSTTTRTAEAKGQIWPVLQHSEEPLTLYMKNCNGRLAVDQSHHTG